MRAEYDSEADALSIDLMDVERWDGADEDVDDTYCHVATAGGEPANIELLNPREQLELLDLAAQRYELDAEQLRVLATAALAAPNRTVEVKLGAGPTRT
jgi:hypothetical protein